jgi:hypothetical protein
MDAHSSDSMAKNVCPLHTLMSLNFPFCYMTNTDCILSDEKSICFFDPIEAIAVRLVASYCTTGRSFDLLKKKKEVKVMNY